MTQPRDSTSFGRAGNPDQEAVYQKSLEGDAQTKNKTLAFVREIAHTAHDSSARVREAIARYKTPVNYGSESQVSSLSVDLKKVAALISAGFPTRIYYASIGGFDTHANQLNQQQSQLMYTWDAIGGFVKDVKRLGRGNDVAVMVFTEFGRRVAENQSAGTDHGAAGPMFILGERVKGGLYGTYPSLTDLDANGDLKMTVDFRRVYSTMIREWLGYEDTKTILKGDFATLNAFA